jgi:hypothetical protein
MLRISASLLKSKQHTDTPEKPQGSTRKRMACSAEGTRPWATAQQHHQGTSKSLDGWPWAAAPSSPQRQALQMTARQLLALQQGCGASLRCCRCRQQTLLLLVEAPGDGARCCCCCGCRPALADHRSYPQSAAAARVQRARTAPCLLNYPPAVARHTAAAAAEAPAAAACGCCLLPAEAAEPAAAAQACMAAAAVAVVLLPAAPAALYSCCCHPSMARPGRHRRHCPPCLSCFGCIAPPWSSQSLGAHRSH